MHHQKHKILLLGDGKSIHLIRWIKALCKDFQLGIFSLNGFDAQLKVMTDVELFDAEVMATGWKKKLNYLKTLPSLKKALRSFQPDVVHAHYASSYGLLGRLSGFHPFVISAWGSDVFEFPRSGVITRNILTSNLKAADYLLVSSNALAKELKQYTNQPSECIYYGVDANQFQPSNQGVREVPVIGIAKSLAPIYGIDRLIRVCHELRSQGLSFKVKIAGDGNQQSELQQLATALGVDSHIEWTGRIAHADLPKFYQSCDVACFLSRAESFGVSAIEAMSCGLPVVTSDAPGFVEIVRHKQTGFIANVNANEDLSEVVQHLESLLTDAILRREMGQNAAKDVVERFNWHASVEKQIAYYQRILSK